MTTHFAVCWAQDWIIYFPYVLAPALFLIGSVLLIWENSHSFYKGMQLQASTFSSVFHGAAQLGCNVRTHLAHLL